MVVGRLRFLDFPFDFITLRSGFARNDEEKRLQIFFDFVDECGFEGIEEFGGG